MKRTGNRSNWVWIILVIFGLAVPAIAMASQHGETFACIADDKLEKTVAPEAELEAFTCSYKKWEGSETLHFNVTVKNVSDKDQRYKVNIFLDNGKAVGGLIPRKTKEGLVKPGESASFTYPVKGMAEKPQAVILTIKTLSE